MTDVGEATVTSWWCGGRGLALQQLDDPTVTEWYCRSCGVLFEPLASGDLPPHQVVQLRVGDVVRYEIRA